MSDSGSLRMMHVQGELQPVVTCFGFKRKQKTAWQKSGSKAREENEPHKQNKQAEALTASVSS